MVSEGVVSEGVVSVSNGQVLVSVSVSNDEVSVLVSVSDYEAETPSLISTVSGLQTYKTKKSAK